jgi:hypothetical protein
MINRMGFDDPDWTNYITRVRLENEDDDNFYYSTWKGVSKYYGWKRVQEVRNESDYYFNIGHFKTDNNHWFGYQRYKFNGEFDQETGPFKDNHMWWEVEPVPIHVKQISNNVRTTMN